MLQRITLEQLHAMRRLLGLDESVFLVLKGFHPRVERKLDEFANDICTVLGGDGRTPSVLFIAKGNVEPLRESLRAWIESMLYGANDEQSYLVIRFRLEERFADAEIPQALALGGMAQLRQCLLRFVFELDESVDSKGQLVVAICRAVDLEIAILLENYRYRLLDRLMATERLSTMGQLVASIGHELRNPLSTIETSAYLLLQKLPRQGEGEIDAQAVRLIEKIRQQVRGATKTVSDLLEFAQSRRPQRYLVPLRELIIASLNGISATNAVSVAIEVDHDVMVYVDYNQLRIVLVNLLSNACDAVGGEGKIEISAQVSRGGVSLRVTDDGPGIHGHAREKVFQPLYTTKTNGHGLGLPLCRRIAEAHGGCLELEQVERGTAFHLWLPGPESKPEISG